MKQLTTLPKKMQIKEFMSKPTAVQSQLLRAQGTFLDSERENEETINLYYFDGFYVEEYVTPGTHDVHAIIPFRRGFKLSHYIDNNGNRFERAMTQQIRSSAGTVNLFLN